MRLSGTKTSSVNQYNGLGDQLYDLGGAKPTLDLNFSSNESLVDSVTGKTLVDHTRQSSATYVDGDGVIKTAVTNLVLQSEDFSTTWTNAFTVDSPNQTTSPDGKNNGFSLVNTADNQAHTIYQSVSFSATTTTFSLFVKYLDHQWISLRIGASGDQYFGSWDVQNGVKGSVTAGATTDIQPYSNGWYRIVLTAPLSSASTNNLVIGLNNSDTAGFNTYIGTGTGIYLWGAQLEQSSTVGQYVKTTTAKNGAPRFDHDPTTGESLGLLVEESRQNLVTYSQELDNAAWTNAGTFTWTPSTDLAPDGSLTVDKPSVVFTYWGFYDATNVAWLSGYPAAFPFTVTSSWTKQSVTITAPAGCTSLRFYPGRVGGSGSYFYQPVTVTPGTTYTASAYYKLDSASSTVLVWGAQLEAGSFPTSYIPTEGSTVTRAADVASITGTNFSSWYEQSEGTIFGNAATPFAVNNVQIADARVASTDIVQIGFNTESRSVGYVKAGNSNQALMFSQSVLTGVRRRKVVMGYAENNFASVCNGLAPITDDSGSPPTNIGSIYLGSRTGLTSFLNGTIRRLTYWPTRLSNDTLQTITT